jgi:hypothetical protein
MEVAACGCVPGATARTTFAPDGTATVICQDQRMSLLNPGDQMDGMQTLPDPCATFECGAFGQCVPVNMTPTCVCQQGYVATGGFDEDGVRRTTCVTPIDAIPDSFYDGRRADLPEELPGGVEVDVPDPTPGAAGEASTSGESGSGGSSVSGSGGSGASAAGGLGGAGGGGGAPATAVGKRKRDGCSVSGRRDTSFAWWMLLAPLALVARRRGYRVS